MEKKKINKLISLSDSLACSSFSQNVLKILEPKYTCGLEKIVNEDYFELSFQLDAFPIQESSLVRNALRCRALAQVLINEKGDLHEEIIDQSIHFFLKNPYFLGRGKEVDGYNREHILNVLLSLQKDKEIRIQIKKISRPFSNFKINQVIIETLQLPKNTIITDAHAKQAAIAAWMTLIRQNVGSCFATAPAILIQREQPLQLLRDIEELYAKGSLVRVIDGVDYTVPMSYSCGIGDTKKPFFYNSIKDDLHLQPGFHKAFERIGFIQSSLSIEEKENNLKKLFCLIKNEYKQGTIVTAEEILEKILQKSCKFKEKKKIKSDLVYHYSDKLLLNKPVPESKHIKELEEALLGFKSLTDNALLKTWEFTLASFSDTKSDFYRWNLFTSLGFNKDEPISIGECLQSYIDRKIKDYNQKIQEYQLKYEQVYYQVKYLAAKLKNSTSEREANWVKIEYQSHVHEMEHYQELRDKVHEKGNTFSSLFSILLKLYDKHFPRYFQEIYDASMRDVNVSFYDDAPAGFRLVYKHGRANTAQWSMINNQEQFSQALVDFFVAMETEIGFSEEIKEFREDYAEFTSDVIPLVKSDVFVEAAINRLARKYQEPLIKNPLKNLNKIHRKPWVYISGGTMSHLISTYYRLKKLPDESSRWVETEQELLVFLLEIMKDMSTKMREKFEKNPEKSLLAYSPTHAFLVKPGLSPFFDGWHHEYYTYSWLRDELEIPRKVFNYGIEVDDEIICSFFVFLKNKMPIFERFINKLKTKKYGRVKLKYFRNCVLNQIKSEKKKNPGIEYELSEVHLDSYLYTYFPVTRKRFLKENITEIINNISLLNNHENATVLDLFDELISQRDIPFVISSDELYYFIKDLLILSLDNKISSTNYPQLLAEVMQNIGLTMPKPIFFADTNWENNYFAFVVNPGTDKFELWRVDKLGLHGSPMKSWKKWLNGRDKKKWGVFTNPIEYQT